jgi:ankyrin repeat protein
MNLYDAAMRGDLNKVQQLVEQGADKEARNNNGWTPLRTAAFKGHLNIV